VAGFLERLEGGLAAAPSRFLPEPVRRLQRELADRLRRTGLQLNTFGFDAYGFSPETALQLFLPMALLARYYFRIASYGIENVPRGRVILIANHAGQFAHDGAMTGELTLTGRVLPIGGVKEKVLGAVRAGITQIIVPIDNEADLEDIPEDVRATLTFHLAETLDDVIETALADPPSGGGDGRSTSRPPARKRAPRRKSAST
jgi:hypothetical protein